MGQGEGVAGAAGGESEAARCSSAEDREDGRGRPCLFNDKFPQS